MHTVSVSKRFYCNTSASAKLEELLVGKIEMSNKRTTGTGSTKTSNDHLS